MVVIVRFTAAEGLPKSLVGVGAQIFAKQILHRLRYVDMTHFIVSGKPPAVLVIPKSFSFAKIIYPSEVRNQVAFSCGRRGTVVVDEELDCAKDTSSVSLRLPPSPTGEGLG